MDFPPTARAEWFSRQHALYEHAGEIGENRAGRLVKSNSETLKRGIQLQSSLEENVFELPTCWTAWYLEQFEQGIDSPVLQLDEEWVEYLSTT